MKCRCASSPPFAAVFPAPACGWCPNAGGQWACAPVGPRRPRERRPLSPPACKFSCAQTTAGATSSCRLAYLGIRRAGVASIRACVTARLLTAKAPAEADGEVARALYRRGRRLASSLDNASCFQFERRPREFCKASAELHDQLDVQRRRALGGFIASAAGEVGLKSLHMPLSDPF